jgi:hypothetical protein
LKGKTREQKAVLDINTENSTILDGYNEYAISVTLEKSFF